MRRKIFFSAFGVAIISIFVFSYAREANARNIISLVTDNATSTGATVTISSPAPNDTLILTSVNNTTSNTLTVTSPGVTWKRAGGSCTNACLDLWYGLVTSSTPGTTINVTWATAGNAITDVAEFSNVARINPLDGSPATNTGTGTTATTSAYTNGNANDLIIGTVGNVGSAAITLKTTGWSNLNGGALGNGGTKRAFLPSFFLASSSIAQNASWTWATSVGWDSLIVGLKAFSSHGTNIRGGKTNSRVKIRGGGLKGNIKIRGGR